MATDCRPSSAIHEGAGQEDAWDRITPSVTDARPVTAEHHELPDLVSRIQAGDHVSETHLVERFARGVSIILRRYVFDPDLRDDLFQETFRLVLTKVRDGAIREPEKLAGFVSGTTRNLARDHGRRVARQATDPVGDGFAEYPAGGSDALGEMLRSERARLVRDVLGELGVDRDREILRRHYLGEESKTTICSDLGLEARHYDRVLFRARKRYKEKLLARLDGRTM